MLIWFLKNKFFKNKTEEQQYLHEYNFMRCLNQNWKEKCFFIKMKCNDLWKTKNEVD